MDASNLAGLTTVVVMAAALFAMSVSARRRSKSYTLRWRLSVVLGIGAAGFAVVLLLS